MYILIHWIVSVKSLSFCSLFFILFFFLLFKLNNFKWPVFTDIFSADWVSCWTPLGGFSVQLFFNPEFLFLFFLNNFCSFINIFGFYFIFLISFSCLSIFHTVILTSCCSNFESFVTLQWISRDLFCSFEGTLFPWLFLFLVIFCWKLGI